jgi:hypothetical protein
VEDTDTRRLQVDFFFFFYSPQLHQAKMLSSNKNQYSILSFTCHLQPSSCPPRPLPPDFTQISRRQESTRCLVRFDQTRPTGNESEKERIGRSWKTQTPEGYRWIFFPKKPSTRLPATSRPGADQSTWHAEDLSAHPRLKRPSACSGPGTRRLRPACGPGIRTSAPGGRRRRPPA